MKHTLTPKDIEFIERKVVRWMTDLDNEIDGYMSLVCVLCKKDTGELYMQNQTSEVYCRNCLIYKQD